MLTTDELLAHYAEKAGADTARLLERAIEIVAAQLETSCEVAPAERPWAQHRSLEIAAKRYPELVAAVLNANARLYVAQIVAMNRRGAASGG